MGTGEGVKLLQDGVCVGSWTSANGLAGDAVGPLREDEEGRLWFGIGREGVELWQRLDPRTGELKFLQEVLGETDVEAGGICPAGRQKLWLTTDHELISSEGGVIRRFPAANLWRRDLFPGDITLGDKGDLWFAPPSMEKLVRFANGRFDVFGVEDGLADADIRKLLWDREGNLWVGYGAGGIQRLRQRSIRSVLTRQEQGQRQQIDAVALGPDSALWLGSWDGLLRVQDTSVKRFTNAFLYRHKDARPVLAARNGRVWLGTRECGLFNLEGDRIVPVPAADFGRTNWSVSALYEDRSGRLWIGSNSGLLERRGETFIRYTKNDGLLDDDITGVLDGPDGALWVGTRHGGIQRLRGGSWRTYTTKENLLSNEARPLMVENDGAVWVGTPAGLNRIGSDGKIGQATQTEGLPRNELFCLIEDGAGWCWANSVQGVFRMRHEDLGAVADGTRRLLSCVTYGEADGATSAEGSGEYQPNVCRASDGKLWFCSTRGVIVADPAQTMQQEPAPPVLIEEVYADGELIYQDGRRAGSNLSGNEDAIPTTQGEDRLHPNATPVQENEGRERSPVLRLGPRRARDLRIRYTANSFVAPAKVQFKYLLEGHDSDWRNAEMNERCAYYTDLHPGSYRFRVQACNSRGVWNEARYPFEFSLTPSFTQTPLFPGLCALGLIAASGMFGVWRLRWQRRVLLAEQNVLLEQERARIARDLHDDLGTALTGLALEADMARRSQNGWDEALARISTGNRALANRMREVVWAINPRCDWVDRITDFFQQYAEELARAAGLRCRFEVPIEMEKVSLGTEARHQLFSAFKEALHNVVKHARASEVEIAIQVDDKAVHLRVADNGVGFNEAGAALGNGLRNMRDRLSAVGGHVKVEARPGSGTMVTMELPLERGGHRMILESAPSPFPGKGVRG